jgi:tRNA 2-thiouridine synthesizing protein C
VSSGEPRILVLCRSAPYGSSRVRDALDLAMALGAFEQAVSLLLMDDAVLMLLPDQDPSPAVSKSLLKVSGALETFGVSAVLADADALAKRGLAATDLPEDVTVLGTAELAETFARHRLVLSV